MTQQSRVVPVLENEIVKVPFAASIGKVEPFSKTINFGNGVKLLKATLVLSATQTYLSGAEITLNMNGRLATKLNWHGNQNFKLYAYKDVTDLMYDGVNKFELLYTLAYGAITEQSAVCNAQLELVLLNPDPKSEPVNAGKTTETDVISNLGQKAREAGNYIIAGLAATAFVLAGAYVVLKRD